MDILLGLLASLLLGGLPLGLIAWRVNQEKQYLRLRLVQKRYFRKA